MMKVNRAELLAVLESIQPGLTLKETVEQSYCFAFKDGEVMTFNDEVACRRKSPLKKLEGAVTAEPLLAILRKFPDELVDVSLEENELVVRGAGDKVGIRTIAEVNLPIEKVESADNWKPLHEDFTDAIYCAQQCVGKDESNYATTCIHIHPKFIEACDNSQALRYKIKTRVKEPMLVRGSSIKHIVGLDFTEFCETETWIHFTNSTGLIFSCRRDVQEYESLDAVLKVEGEPLTLPKGIAEKAERAEIFSAQNADENEVTVEIKPGRMRIIGDGVSGWYTGSKKLKYAGPAMSFRIGPKLLVELVKRYNDCVVAPNRLKVDSGKFVYVVALGNPESNGEAE